MRFTKLGKTLARVWRGLFWMRPKMAKLQVLVLHFVAGT
jgi:hypothetical protein